MKVSFDGNVFVGKSTIISELSKSLGGVIIPDHSYFIESVPFISEGSGVMATQQRYLQVELLRTEFATEEVINILDRSFLSLLAHTYAIYKMCVADIRSDFLKLLLLSISKNEIIIPDVFVFIRCRYDVAKSRFMNGCQEKGTDSLYISKEYYSAVDIFHSRWMAIYGGVEVDTSENLSTGSYEILFKQIFSERHPAVRLQRLEQGIRLCLDLPE